MLIKQFIMFLLHVIFYFSISTHPTLFMYVRFLSSWELNRKEKCGLHMCCVSASFFYNKDLLNKYIFL